MIPASSRPICARPHKRRNPRWGGIPGVLPRRPNRGAARGATAMAAIEPNWISLIWFAAFATICMIAFLVVSGMFPLGSRPEQARSGAATLLVVGNGVLLAAL